MLPALSLEQWLTVLGAGVATVGFAFGLYQYWAGLKWKRVEFVAQEMKGFLDDAKVQTALKLLDWRNYERDQLPYPGEGDGNPQVGDDDVGPALVPHRFRPQGFSLREAWLREVFDAFFDGLERFEHYRRTGVVKVHDLKPYLAYWVEKVARHPDAGVRDSLSHFVADYHTDAITLFARFGHDVAPEPDKAPVHALGQASGLAARRPADAAPG